MSDVLITSFANPSVKRYKALAARKHRRREHAFTVEGLQPVWRAVTAAQQSDSPWRLDTLIVAPDLLTHEPAWQMVDVAERDGIPVLRTSAEVFAHLSDRDGPSGLAAIVGGEVADLTGFRPGPTGPVIALHHVGNPGNIGTILRSADAAGAAGLVLVGQSADPLAPAAVKASMGSLFAVPVATTESENSLFGWAVDHGRAVVAVTGRGADVLWSASLDERCVLIFGSEGDGLPDEVADRCDQAVAIPMTGTAESLNLATATSVTLFELARRRYEAGL